jgi:hypothetical protein
MITFTLGRVAPLSDPGEQVTRLVVMSCKGLRYAESDSYATVTHTVPSRRHQRKGSGIRGLPLTVSLRSVMESRLTSGQVSVSRRYCRSLGVLRRRGGRTPLCQTLVRRHDLGNLCSEQGETGHTRQ